MFQPHATPLKCDLASLSYTLTRMNTCPLLCDGCGNYLHQPFKLPCLQHFIGGCCREAMFREEMPMQCPVDHQDISPEFDWTVDRAALENRLARCVRVYLLCTLFVCAVSELLCHFYLAAVYPVHSRCYIPV